MRILLISTYELGRQPVHLASPAATLKEAGHQVDTLDLSVDPLREDTLDDVDAVGISVPMHTAMRLAAATAERIRSWRPGLPIALYGLYAAVGRASTLGIVADALFAGEYERGLTAWAASGGNANGLSMDVSPGRFTTPDRSSLPPVTEYARLEWGGTARRAGAVEASHGCRHRCRHCPIPVLYDGRMRIVGPETVLADIDQLVEAGVEHVTFGDPDFMNAPRYSADLLRAAHLRHPQLTFDATVKVSHVLERANLWPEMAGSGLLFVVSAFESVDPGTLEILDKGHTVDDMRRATDVLRSSGVFIRPTWLPFFPWTTLKHLTSLVGFLDEMTLWEATDPVQLAIKLLIPEGSLLESHPAVREHLIGYEPSSFTWAWEFQSPVVARLHGELDVIAAEASDCDAESMTTLDRMRDLIGAAAGVDFGRMAVADVEVPRLSESWFCCAEPTGRQAISAGLSIGTSPDRSGSSVPG